MSTLISKESVMTAKQNTPSKSQGFSLVELLVLVAIIAILAGLSGTALMKWVPQANLKRAARTIVSMCQEAKIEAIKRNHSVSINCVDPDNTCKLQIVSGNALRQFNLNTVSGVHVKSTAGSTFTSRGRATANTITVRNNAGQELNIVISPSGSIATRQ